jgi:putative ABC transport system substrate-binding protein
LVHPEAFPHYQAVHDYANAHGLEYAWEGTAAFEERLRTLSPGQFQIVAVHARERTAIDKRVMMALGKVPRHELLELLKQLIPTLHRVAVLRPDDPAVPFSVQETQAAASTPSLTLQIFDARTLDDFDNALLAASKEGCEAVVLLPNPVFVQRAGQMAAFAIARRLPTLEFATEPVRAGILMSYGGDLLASFRRLAYFVDRILKGANPADLPVEQPTKFELAINLKTAKAIGLTVPPTLLAIADEVIE